VMKVADAGYRQALLSDAGFRNGLNVARGRVTHKAVADALNYPWVDPHQLLSSS